MDVNTLVSAISTVGFPIIAAVGLFYLYDKTVKELTNTITKIDTTLGNMELLLISLTADNKDVL